MRGLYILIVVGTVIFGLALLAGDKLQAVLYRVMNLKR